jgi:hypothetical protein
MVLKVNLFRNLLINLVKNGEKKLTLCKKCPLYGNEVNGGGGGGRGGGGGWSSMMKL